MFNGDLWKQQPTATVPADEQTVATDFNFLRSNGFCGREYAQLNLEMGSFFFRHRWKPFVVESRGPSGFCDGSVDGVTRQNVANATAQLTVKVK